MKFSVIIPAYNASKTIGATLDAVLAQTTPAYEILVCNDGSTDNTAAVLKAYQGQVAVFSQANRGVAHARNLLCAHARGDVLAFLDADDIWHPRYLECQSKFIAEHTKAAAWFTEHTDFSGYGNYQWAEIPGISTARAELIKPKDFIIRYDQTPLSFQMSCCCMPRNILPKLRGEPFQVSGAEDTFLHNLLPLIGPVAHSSTVLSAYRVHESSLSSNRLRVALLILDAFALLEEAYRLNGDASLHRVFRSVYASRRRNCGKYLMGAGRAAEARQQFLLAARTSLSLSSMGKSLGLFCFSWLARPLQPRWPAVVRESAACRTQ